MTALLEWLFVDSVKTSLYCSFTFPLFFFQVTHIAICRLVFILKDLQNCIIQIELIIIRYHNLIITIPYLVGIKNDYILFDIGHIHKEYGSKVRIPLHRLHSMAHMCSTL